jgi:hypothetical protein
VVHRGVCPQQQSFWAWALGPALRWTGQTPVMAAVYLCDRSTACSTACRLDSRVRGPQSSSDARGLAHMMPWEMSNCGAPVLHRAARRALELYSGDGAAGAPGSSARRSRCAGDMTLLLTMDGSSARTARADSVSSSCGAARVLLLWRGFRYSRRKGLYEEPRAPDAWASTTEIQALRETHTRAGRTQLLKSPGSPFRAPHHPAPQGGGQRRV